jgi:RNA polymerase sigma-70 factor, ECF subfamily
MTAAAHVEQCHRWQRKWHLGSNRRQRGRHNQAARRKELVFTHDTSGEHSTAPDNRAPRTTTSDERDESVDTPSWDSLWRRHEGEVLRYAMHLLGGDVHTAEDIAQETALRLWQRRASTDVDRPLGAWLRTVTRRIVVDHYRRRQSRPNEVPLAPDVDPAVLDGIDEVDALHSVQTILADLAPRHRAAVLAVYVDDRAVRDAATHLGVPPGTVKSRCHTALHQLRDQAALRCA